MSIWVADDARTNVANARCYPALRRQPSPPRHRFCGADGRGDLLSWPQRGGQDQLSESRGRNPPPIRRYGHPESAPARPCQAQAVRRPARPDDLSAAHRARKSGNRLCRAAPRQPPSTSPLPAPIRSMSSGAVQWRCRAARLTCQRTFFMPRSPSDHVAPRPHVFLLRFLAALVAWQDDRQTGSLPLAEHSTGRLQ